MTCGPDAGRARPEILAVNVTSTAARTSRTCCRMFASGRSFPHGAGLWVTVAARRRSGGATKSACRLRRKDRWDTTINYVTHTEASFIVDASGHERALFLWPFYPQDVERALRQFT